jgi:hypothetical protein
LPSIKREIKEDRECVTADQDLCEKYYKINGKRRKNFLDIVSYVMKIGEEKKK